MRISLALSCVALCICATHCSKSVPKASADPVDHFRAKRWRGPGDLPAVRYHAAAAQVSRMPIRPIGGSGPWEALGPTNTGGRVKAMVIDPVNPDTMYAAAATGGIWKTTDGAQSWFPLTDHLPALTSNSLVMDPSDHNTLYLGTGEVLPGAGIFKTKDGGQTWTQLAATASFAYVYSLAVSTSRPSNVYAAPDSGLWSSLDGGQTWTQSLPMQGGCFSTVVRGDQPADIVFAACTQGNGTALAFFTQEAPQSGSLNSYAVYRNSAGSSSNWQMVLSAAAMGTTVLAIAPNAPDTIYALSVDNNPSDPFYFALAGLFASDQGGDRGTWEQRASMADANGVTANILSYPRYYQGCSFNTNQAHHGQGAWNLGLAVDPTDSQVLFVAGAQLSRSTDGGRTFAGLTTTPNLYFHTDFHAFAFHPNYDGNSNQTLFVTLDGGIYRSNVARTTARFAECGSDPYYDLTGGAVINGLQIAQFYFGTVAPGGAYYLGGTQDTVTILTTPGKMGWAGIYNGDGGPVVFNPANPQTFYIESSAAPANPPLLKTTNGGQTFGWAGNGITAGSGAGYFNGLALDPNNPQTVYYGLGSLWRSLDGAATWSIISSPTGAPISTIAVNPANSAEVVFGNTAGNVYHGSPGLWNVVQPRQGYVSSLTFDANQPGVVYATYSQFRATSGDAQVYVSVDHGATWSPLGLATLPDIPVHVLIVDSDVSSTLYIGTDMGIFASYDSGRTWKHDSSFPNVITESLYQSTTEAGRYLYAFTHGRGAWQVKVGKALSPDYR